MKDLDPRITIIICLAAIIVTIFVVIIGVKVGKVDKLPLILLYY